MILFRKTKEIRSQQGRLHFQRFTIIGTRWFALNVHRIHDHDRDPDLHNHPWNFIGVVLWGSYINQKEDGKLEFKSTFSISRMNRNQYHKIHSVIYGPVTTLNLMYGKRTDWGYLLNGAHIDAGAYRNHLKNLKQE